MIWGGYKKGKIWYTGKKMVKIRIFTDDLSLIKIKYKGQRIAHPHLAICFKFATRSVQSFNLDFKREL